MINIKLIYISIFFSILLFITFPNSHATPSKLIDVFINEDIIRYSIDLEFGPDGNLYVSSHYTNQILRFDGTTGEFIDIFASGGGLDRPFGLVFGPDDNLYVSNHVTDQILRFDGTTGEFIDIFASGGGLDRPFGLDFHNGYLYVGSHHDGQLLRYNSTNGEFIDIFLNIGEKNNPPVMLFGPDDVLYIGSQFNSKILRYVETLEKCEENEILINNMCIQKDIPSSNGGCLIATATYGTELAPQVQQLRELRDNIVLKTNSGITFMTTFNQFYYSFSPTVADFEREQPIFKEVMKVTLTPMLLSLSLLNHVDIDSEQEMLGYGISIILLNIGIYLSPFYCIVIIRKFRN